MGHESAEENRTSVKKRERVKILENNSVVEWTITEKIQEGGGKGQ